LVEKKLYINQGVAKKIRRLDWTKKRAKAFSPIKVFKKIRLD